MLYKMKDDIQIDYIYMRCVYMLVNIIICRPRLARGSAQGKKSYCYYCCNCCYCYYDCYCYDYCYYCSTAILLYYCYYCDYCYSCEYCYYCNSLRFGGSCTPFRT